MNVQQLIDQLKIVTENFDTTQLVTNEAFYCRAHSAEQE